MANRFLHGLIQSYLVTPSRIPDLLRTLRASLFPNNSLSPARSPPSHEETLKIRRQAAESVLGLVPNFVAKRVLSSEDPDSRPGTEARDGSDWGSDTENRERELHMKAIEDILDIFGDHYMNKHLVFALVELVLVKLMPEIAEKTPQELLKEKGIVGMGFEGFNNDS